MSATPTPHPAVHRLNKAYVQVPSSPLNLSSYCSVGTPTHVAASSKLKENTPSRPFQSAMSQHTSTSASSSHKRKISDRDSSSLILDGVVITSKKSKLSNGRSGPLKSTQMHPDTVPDNASSEYPNGFTYCHQCSKKRDVKDTLRCTVVERYQTSKDKIIKERLCVNKYCKPCLKNRYGEDLDDLKSAHGKTNGYQCPRCRDICNCPRCRKSKGLEPIGAILKEKGKNSDEPPKQKKLNDKMDATIKAKEAVKLKSRELPTITWTRVPTRLSLEEVNERMFIREFFLRFGDFMDPPVAKTHIEELELIAGRPRKLGEDDDSPGWVGDMCVKALIISLLGLVAHNYPEHIAKMIKTTLKDVRSAGANLNKIWSSLSSLRDQVGKASAVELSVPGEGSIEVETIFLLNDPEEPPPQITWARRSLRQSESGQIVVVSAQMIPVLTSLIHYALGSRIIREEIEQGSKDIKEWGPIAKDATRIENERWEMDRESITAAKNKTQKTENRAKRILHKEQLANIENCMKIIAPSFAPRFMSLGVDDENREYYALSPGVAEREAATQYLELATRAKPSKPRKKGRILPFDDRCELREWSWFVAVYGSKPREVLATQTPYGTSYNSDWDDSDSDGDDDDQWWGFWDPKEINSLAEWVSIKSGFDPETDSTGAESGGSTSTKQKAPLLRRDAQLKRLIAELKDYADLLQWRVSENKCQLVKENFANLHAKSAETFSQGAMPFIGSLSAAKF